MTEQPLAGHRPTQGTRREFLFLNAGHLADHLFILIYATVAALALPEAFGLDYDALILYATPGFIAFGAFALPAGWLADRWSRRGMLTVFFIGIGLAGIATSFASTPAQIGVGLFAIGVFAAIYHPVGLTMVVELHRERTGFALGVNGVWGNLGVAFAAVLTGWLIDAHSWRAAFFVPGVVTVLIGIAYLFSAAPEIEKGPAVTKPKVALDRSELIRVFAVVGLTTTLGSLIFQSVTVALPKVMDERLDALATSASAVGAYTFIVFAVASAAQLVIGLMVDRFSIRTVFACVALFQAPAFALAMGLSGTPMLMTAVVFMLLVFGQIPINDALLSRVTTPQYRSRIFAVKFVLSFAVAACAVPLVSFVHGSSGFDTLFAIFAVTAVAIFVTVLALPGRAVRPTAQLPPLTAV